MYYFQALVFGILFSLTFRIAWKRIRLSVEVRKIEKKMPNFIAGCDMNNLENVKWLQDVLRKLYAKTYVREVSTTSKVALKWLMSIGVLKIVRYSDYYYNYYKITSISHMTRLLNSIAERRRILEIEQEYMSENSKYDNLSEQISRLAEAEEAARH